MDKRGRGDALKTSVFSESEVLIATLTGLERCVERVVAVVMGMELDIDEKRDLIHCTCDGIEQCRVRGRLWF